MCVRTGGSSITNFLKSQYGVLSGHNAVLLTELKHAKLNLVLI